MQESLKDQSKKTTNKQVAIFAGGHGIYPLQNILNQNHLTFNIITPPADWGGFTGVIGRAFESENINQVVHGVKLPNLPFGDFNKIIGFFLGKRYCPEVEKAFIGKSSCKNMKSYFTFLQKNFRIFAKSIKFDAKVESEFLNYINCILSNCFANDVCIEGGSIAHFFNAWVYSKTTCMIEFNKFCHSLKIIPDNINLYFLVEHDRVKLIGTDCIGDKLEGEDAIDTHIRPINPNTLKLINIDNTPLLESQLTPIFNIVKECDIVIIANGSLANYLPVCNDQVLYNALFKEMAFNGQLYVMMNLFASANENNFGVLVGHLKKIGIDPVYIGTSLKIHWQDLEDILRLYSEDGYGKQVNKPDTTLAAAQYFAALSLITEADDPTIKGIKYCPESVARAFKPYLR